MYRRLLYRSYRRSFGLAYWVSRRFTNAGKYALACLMVATALGADTNQSTAYQACAFLTVVFVISLLWTVLGLPHPFLRNAGLFSVRRMAPRFGTAGSPVAYTVTVKINGPYPQRGITLLEDLEDPRPSLPEFSARPRGKAHGISDRLDRLLGFSRWSELMARRLPAVIPEHTVPDLPPHGETDVRVEFTPHRRGRIHFTGLTLARPDVFGLVRRYWRISLPQTLLVLPKRYILPRVTLPGISEYQPAGVALASAVGQSDEFISLRDYRSGDPLRHIHWKSVAKVDRLIVRENEDEFFVRHALILDTFAESEQEKVFEEAVSVAASFVCSIQTQESLLDLLFVGAEAYCFTAGRGVGHVDRMLEILAGVDLCLDKAFPSLETLVLGHASQVSGCVCVFLSWDKPRQKLVKLLQSLHVPVRVCVVTDDHETGVLEPGPMKNQPRNFHHLRVGKIQEALSRL
jgi:uncharacterized protein (DUF58 family)